MKKIILIPDSFKGTMSSIDICNIMDYEIRKYHPNAKIISIPVADGGEGTVDAFLSALGGKKIFINVCGPNQKKVSSFYGRINDYAIIEMSAASGLPLAGEDEKVEKYTTFGVGELIKDAIESGAKKIIVGLGGSATNDGGVGAAVALGIKFYDTLGNEFLPVGDSLCKIAKIDVSGKYPGLDKVKIITMCDVDNPLCGERGAAQVFAPQKGADSKTVKILDSGLAHFAKIVKRDLGYDILNLPGAGAAGGMGGGMVALLNSELQKGIQTVLELVKFDELLVGTDAVFTGEGKIDNQSLGGKVVIGVAERAMKKSVPVFAIVGDIGDDIDLVYEKGIHGIFSINRVAVPYSEAKKRARHDLHLTMDNLMKYTNTILAYANKLNS